MQNFFNQIYFGNSIAEYVTAIGIFIVGILIIKILDKIFLRRLKKWAENTETKLDDFLVRGMQRTLIPLLYFISLYAAIKYLNVALDWKGKQSVLRNILKLPR